MNFRILAALLLTTWELGFRASAQGVFVLTDLLGSAPMISTPGWQIRGPIGTNSAGAEAGEPAHAGSPALASQWVQLRFPESGFISLTVGNQEGIRIAVYTGPSVSNLAEVTSAAVTPRRNSFGWEVQAGVTYSLAVDLISGARPQTSTEIYGAFLREFLRPQVSPLPDQAPATVTLDPVLLDPGEEINRVSYSSGDGRTIRRSQPPWSVTVTNLYGGTSTVSAQVASNRRAGLLLPLFQISLRSPNDHWHQAGIVPGDSVDWSSAGNVELATVEAGEPPFAAGGSAGGSIWWRWTPAFNAWTRVDFAGSGSTLQLYSGTQLEELIEWPLPAGGTFYAEAGRPYAIRLSRTPNQRSFGTTVGLHRTTLRLQPPESVLVETNAGGGFDVRVTSGQSHQFTTQEFNPLDTLPSVQLERLTEAGWIVLDSVEALPRRFAITAPDGSVETYRVSGTNQTGAFRSSDPVRVIAAPAHDRFEHAIVLPAEGLPDWSWAGVSVAGRESGEPPLGPVAHSGSLWFRWTPSGPGTGSVRIPQTAGPTIIAVFTGDSLKSLQPVAARMVADAGQTLEFPFQVSAGVTYYIALGGVEPSGPVSLELIPIHVVPVPHELTVGVPTPLSATRFEGSGPEVLWMLGSEPLLSLTPDPSASASWTPTNTGPFTLRASANFGAGPVLLFEVSGFVRPANDSTAAATLLTEYQGLPGFFEIKGDLTAATREPGDPSALDGAGGTVWYEWTVPVGNLRARQTSGLPGLRMDLFAVDGGGLLTQGQSLTGLDQVQSLKVDPGVHVLMAISSPFPEAAAFKVFLGPAPANDDFENATVLTASSSGATIPLSTANILATTEDAEINLPALEPFRRYGSLWWKFTGPEFGGALFHLLDSQVPNTAAVFTGTSLTNLQLLVGPEAAGDNPVAWVPFQVEPGVSYWIAAGGNPRRDEVFGPVAGAFEFVAAPDLSNDRFSNRSPLSGAEVTVTRSNRSASVEAGEPTGQAQTLWWEWTSPGDGAVRVRVNPLEWGGDSRAFLFTGDTLSGLQSASVTDEVYVSGGQRIAIAVGVSGDGDPGLFELSVRWRTVTPPSSNTRWGEPETLSLNSDVLTGNLHGAVTEEGIFPTGPGGSLWWQFTAPHTGLLAARSRTPVFRD